MGKIKGVRREVRYKSVFIFTFCKDNGDVVEWGVFREGNTYSPQYSQLVLARNWPTLDDLEYLSTFRNDPKEYLEEKLGKLLRKEVRHVETVFVREGYFFGEMTLEEAKINA